MSGRCETGASRRSRSPRPSRGAEGRSAAASAPRSWWLDRRQLALRSHRDLEGLAGAVARRPVERRLHLLVRQDPRVEREVDLAGRRLRRVQAPVAPSRAPGTARSASSDARLEQLGALSQRHQAVGGEVELRRRGGQQQAADRLHDVVLVHELAASRGSPSAENGACSRAARGSCPRWARTRCRGARSSWSPSGCCGAHSWHDPVGLGLVARVGEARARRAPAGPR